MKQEEKEDLSAKFTQGTKEFDNFQEHDVKDTRDYKKERLDGRFYFGIGLFLVFAGFFYYLVNGEEAYIERERDKTLEAQRVQREKRGKSPFDEA